MRRAIKMIKMNSKSKCDLFITVLWIANLIISMFNTCHVREVLFVILFGNCIQSSLKFFEGINYEEE